MSATEKLLKMCLSGGTRFKKHDALRQEIDAILAERDAKAEKVYRQVAMPCAGATVASMMQALVEDLRLARAAGDSKDEVTSSLHADLCEPQVTCQTCREVSSALQSAGHRRAMTLPSYVRALSRDLELALSKTLVDYKPGNELRALALKDATLSACIKLLLHEKDSGQFLVVLDAVFTVLSAEKQRFFEVCLEQAKRMPPEPVLLPGKRKYLSDSMTRLQAEHGEWSRRLFPGQPEKSMISHLRSEAGCDRCGTGELHEGCHPHEIADVALLAMAVANSRGLDLHALCREKFEIVKGRKWDTSGEFPRHIKTLSCDGRMCECRCHREDGVHHDGECCGLPVQGG